MSERTHTDWCRSHSLELCSGCSVKKGWDRSGVTGEPTTCTSGQPHDWRPKSCNCGPNDQRERDRRCSPTPPVAEPDGPGPCPAVVGDDIDTLAAKAGWMLENGATHENADLCRGVVALAARLRADTGERIEGHILRDAIDGQIVFYHGEPPFPLKSHGVEYATLILRASLPQEGDTGE